MKRSTVIANQLDNALTLSLLPPSADSFKFPASKFPRTSQTSFPLLDGSVSMLTFDAEEVARQLCLIEQNLLLKTSRKEYLTRSWLRKERTKGTQTGPLEDLVAHNNRVRK